MLGGTGSDPLPLQVAALPATVRSEEEEGGAERLIRPATVLSEEAMEIMLIMVSRWSPSSWTLGLVLLGV